MDSYRSLVLATVVGVNDGHVVYPCCIRCYAKMLHNRKTDLWQCVRCRVSLKAADMMWRYRLSLCVADSSACCNVSLFGGTLALHFGCPAENFHRFTQGINEETALQAIQGALVGNKYIFCLKTSTAPNMTSSRLMLPSQSVISGPVSLSDLVKADQASHKSAGQLPDFIGVQMIRTNTWDAEHLTVMDVLQQLADRHPKDMAYSQNETCTETRPSLKFLSGRPASKRLRSCRYRESRCYAHGMEESQSAQCVTSCSDQNEISLRKAQDSSFSKSFPRKNVSENLDSSQGSLMFSCQSSMDCASFSQASMHSLVSRKSENSFCDMNVMYERSEKKAKDHDFFAFSSAEEWHCDNVFASDSAEECESSCSYNMEKKKPKLEIQSPCMEKNGAACSQVCVVHADSIDKDTTISLPIVLNSEYNEHENSVDKDTTIPVLNSEYSEHENSVDKDTTIPVLNSEYSEHENRLDDTTIPSDSELPVDSVLGFIQSQRETSREMFLCEQPEPESDNSHHNSFVSWNNNNMKESFSTSLNESSLLLAVFAEEESMHIPVLKGREETGKELVVCEVSPGNRPVVTSALACADLLKEKLDEQLADFTHKLNDGTELSVSTRMKLTMPESEDLSLFLDGMALEQEATSQGAHNTSQQLKTQSNSCLLDTFGHNVQNRLQRLEPESNACLADDFGQDVQNIKLGLQQLNPKSNTFLYETIDIDHDMCKTSKQLNPESNTGFVKDRSVDQDVQKILQQIKSESNTCLDSICFADSMLQNSSVLNRSNWRVKTSDKSSEISARYSVICRNSVDPVVLRVTNLENQVSSKKNEVYDNFICTKQHSNETITELYQEDLFDDSILSNSSWVLDEACTSENVHFCGSSTKTPICSLDNKLDGLVSDCNTPDSQSFDCTSEKDVCDQQIKKVCSHSVQVDSSTAVRGAEPSLLTMPDSEDLDEFLDNIAVNPGTSDSSAEIHNQNSSGSVSVSVTRNIDRKNRVTCSANVDLETENTSSFSEVGVCDTSTNLQKNNIDRTCLVDYVGGTCLVNRKHSDNYEKKKGNKQEMVQSYSCDLSCRVSDLNSGKRECSSRPDEYVVSPTRYSNPRNPLDKSAMNKKEPELVTVKLAFSSDDCDLKTNKSPERGRSVCCKDSRLEHAALRSFQGMDVQVLSESNVGESDSILDGSVDLFFSQSSKGQNQDTDTSRMCVFDSHDSSLLTPVCGNLSNPNSTLCFTERGEFVSCDSLKNKGKISSYLHKRGDHVDSVTSHDLSGKTMKYKNSSCQSLSRAHPEKQVWFSRQRRVSCVQEIDVRLQQYSTHRQNVRLHDLQSFTQTPRRSCMKRSLRPCTLSCSETPIQEKSRNRSPLTPITVIRNGQNVGPAPTITMQLCSTPLQTRMTTRVRKLSVMSPFQHGPCSVTENRTEGLSFCQELSGSQDLFSPCPSQHGGQSAHMQSQESSSAFGVSQECTAPESRRRQEENNQITGLVWDGNRSTSSSLNGSDALFDDSQTISEKENSMTVTPHSHWTRCTPHSHWTRCTSSTSSEASLETTLIGKDRMLDSSAGQFTSPDLFSP